MVVNAFHGMKVIAFQNVMTSNFADTYKHFGGACCLHFRVARCDTDSAFSFEKFVQRWSSMSWVNWDQRKHHFK
jgi:hypothetical protein